MKTRFKPVGLVVAVSAALSKYDKDTTYHLGPADTHSPSDYNLKRDNALDSKAMLKRQMDFESKLVDTQKVHSAGWVLMRKVR